MSPQRQFSQSSLLSPPMNRNLYILNSFCTEENVSECLSYINQEVSSIGLTPVCTESNGSSELNLVALLNSMHDLLQMHRRGLRAVEDMEVEQLKANSNINYLQLSNTRMKDYLERSKRENTGLLERERQLQIKVKSLQKCLKNEKDELQKLQNIIASRASQYNHDMKRKEKEFNKLKERLNQLLVDKKEKKLTIEVLNYIGRPDGKRGLWKTQKTEQRHEGEMYKAVLTDYDSRLKALLLENAELKKVLQHMKRDMGSILSLRKPMIKGERREGGLEQFGSEVEEVFDSSRESLDVSCEHAREKLANSIRLQWRKFKSHVERLDSQASFAQAGESANIDVIPRETHEEEMERLKLEIQQCRDFIQTQQHLLQQQLASPFDEDATSLLNDCYILEEKERLKGEWEALEMKRKSFETERGNFTDAAIRLSHERKAFEEDRASWLKHQFLNFTPFVDQKKLQMSKSQSAISICAEPDVGFTGVDVVLKTSMSHSTFSSSSDFPLIPPLTADLNCNLPLIPENSLRANQKKNGNFQESSNFCDAKEVSQGLQLNGGNNYEASKLHGEKDG